VGGTAGGHGDGLADEHGAVRVDQPASHGLQLQDRCAVELPVSSEGERRAKAAVERPQGEPRHEHPGDLQGLQQDGQPFAGPSDDVSPGGRQAVERHAAEGRPAQAVGVDLRQ
jgi:hypothetical protein